MRGDATFCHDVDFGPQSVWGVERYFEEQLAFFSRWLPDDATGQPEGEAPVRIFVMGGGSRPHDAGGQARPRRRAGARSGSGRRRGASRRPTTSTADGSLSTQAPPAGAEPRRFTFDPAHPVPTIGGLYCAIGELPAEGAGMEQAWARFLSPVLRLRDLLTPGPGGPEGVARVLRLGGAVPAALRTAGRARLPDRAPGRAGRGDGPDDRAPVGLLERARHGLHGEARGRAPRERGLPRRLRHAAQRLRHPLPLPRGLRPGGAARARRPGAGDDHAAADEQPLRQRATGSGWTSPRRTGPGST